jgi:hypothetical protein
MPGSGDRRHSPVIYLHLLDNQPRRQQRCRQSAPTHPSLPFSPEQEIIDDDENLHRM